MRAELTRCSVGEEKRNGQPFLRRSGVIPFPAALQPMRRRIGFHINGRLDVFWRTDKRQCSSITSRCLYDTTDSPSASPRKTFPK